jgi:UDPglucose--hexose-1-phosphate uridylyltransferase
VTHILSQDLGFSDCQSEVTMRGELRKDPATGKWVLVRSRSREERGGDPGVCPFCPGNEHLTPAEIAAYRPSGGRGGADWEVRVFPERDPFFIIEEDLVREGIGMFDRISTRGASEIVVESPNHDMTLASAEDDQIERVLWMYRDRVRDLKQDLKIRNVVVTRRQGKPGSVIRHPYSRILAAPIVFDDVRAELTHAREYFAYKRRCIFCDTIREEIATADRMVHLTPHFAAFVPYAARVSFELRVLPRRHACAYEDISTDEVTDLAGVLRHLCGLVGKAVGDSSYEMTLHTAPNLGVKIVQGEWDTVARDYHWHFEILANPEKATAVSGIAVIDMLPEEAARVLREAGPVAGQGN